MYKNDWQKRYELYIPDKNDEYFIKSILLGHSITKVNKSTLRLDNGIELQFNGNEGCSGCGSGYYYIKELNGCKNIITDVKFQKTNIEYDEYSYKLFVYAENKKIKLLQCDGNDGNGWYGSGYQIFIKNIDFDKLQELKEEGK